MTPETTLTSVEVLAHQLIDMLVSIPVAELARLSVREQFIVFDWCELARERVAKQQHVPVVEVALVRRWMRPEQLAGEWSAFTTWRPAVKQKQQQGLFA